MGFDSCGKFNLITVEVVGGESRGEMSSFKVGFFNSLGGSFLIIFG